MISVLLIWAFMAVTVYLSGTAMTAVLERCCGSRYEIRHNDAVMMAGLAAVTVYSEFWSLAGGVGLAADIVLAGLCAVTAAAVRGRLRTELTKVRDSLTGAKIVWYAVLVLLFAYGTSRGYMHYDSDLYHAQAIHWAESYGAVPGLGNLHTRLAYNSAAFPLTALYSFAYLGGQSYHACAGFMALILAKVCGEAVHAHKTLEVSDLVRAAAAYYLFGIFGEMVSPESDYFMAVSVFYVFIRWCELIRRKEKDMFPYAGLAVLIVWAVTVKLSAAPIIMLALYPLCCLIREKSGRKILVYIAAGIMTALPYFIRNIVISGWLLYPSTAIDICRADWKIPKVTADSDAFQIMEWGRGFTDAGQYESAHGHWVAVWVSGLRASEKVFVAAALIAAAVLIFMTVRATAVRSAEKNGYLFISWAAAGAFIFWLMTSPLIRYGIVFVMLESALVYGMVLTDGSEGQKRSDMSAHVRRYFCRADVVFAVFALLIAYKTCILIKDIYRSDIRDHWVFQQDYGRYDTETYKIGTLTVYGPVSGDRTGYYAFPSAPYQTDIEMRGDSVRNGFRIK